jgi:xylulokinase
VILDVLEAQQPVEDIITIGGGARGEVWLQIFADIWQKPLPIPLYTEEATSLGAAVTGGVGVGFFPDYSVIEKFNPPVRTIMPRRDTAERYRELYGIFNEAYESLLGVHRRLSEYRAKFS